jgi:hypothetical protein
LWEKKSTALPDRMFAAEAYSGTTAGGGKDNAGLVYSLTPPASPGGSWTQAVISNFEGNGAARENPAGVLVAEANGVLYGSTTGGISDYGSFNGEVYLCGRPPLPAIPGHERRCAPLPRGKAQWLSPRAAWACSMALPPCPGQE